MADISGIVNHFGPEPRGEIGGRRLTCDYHGEIHLSRPRNRFEHITEHRFDQGQPPRFRDASRQALFCGSESLGGDYSD